MFITDETVRKRRASRPKVRTGCVNCKKFHKKCDETRPRCGICTLYDRECEYRETIDRRTRAARLARPVVPSGAVTLISRVPRHQVDLTLEEQYFLDFFRRSTSFQCAGHFYDEFWQRLVHQASEDQPAIRHAVIGMGSMNYHFVRSRTSPGPYDQAFSLRQINKAIQSLQQNLIKPGMGRLRVETVLVACVVLVSTLLFQEDALSAGIHLRSGYKLLQQYLMDHGSTSDVSATLTRAFGGVHMVWSSFNSNGALTGDQQPIPLLIAPPDQAADEIQQANDLIVTLVRILAYQNHHHRSGIESGGPPSDMDDGPSLATDPAEFVGKLLGLQSQLKTYRELHQYHLSQRDLNALNILELWAVLLPILGAVESGPGPREMQYDKYLESFKHVLDLAESVLMSDNIDTPSFSVNLGIIPPLCLVSFKCRDPAIRERLLFLFRRSRRQEGIWSTSMIALVLQRVYDIEHAGVWPGEIIPDAARVRAIHVEIKPAESLILVQYHMARVCHDYCRHLENWDSEWLRYRFT
ncbi:unnamed protein product [Penicillium salamii]|uniref:Zn(2)-C6 fungal-type domain-containing protein n=1 Tax=Penicillium salamii TaxID=1612424 RepID=A0A9W4JPP1_9EURO|nr:unnamed protein product [Penicillium salamii]CAG8380987.1 unnamed protein product [Penicillium salamii]CAG8412391.1 unnamed protein product [Penicillium salamii]CAG8412887.1 unnamed protein product [Penicillium salamii]